MRLAWLIWLPLVGLAGCASVPPAPAPVPVPARADEAPLGNWTLTGRMGIQREGESLSGNLDWQHRGETDVLTLATPLGQAVARIERSRAGVVLEIPNRPPRHAPDAETLTREALGYALPVEGLVWWVQARPDPARPAEVVRDASGRVERLEQDGWTIDYLQYADQRPRRLALSREGLELRLVVDSWRVEPR